MVFAIYSYSYFFKLSLLHPQITQLRHNILKPNFGKSPSKHYKNIYFSCPACDLLSKTISSSSQTLS